MLVPTVSTQYSLFQQSCVIRKSGLLETMWVDDSLVIQSKHEVAMRVVDLWFDISRLGFNVDLDTPPSRREKKIPTKQQFNTARNLMYELLMRKMENKRIEEIRFVVKYSDLHEVLRFSGIQPTDEAFLPKNMTIVIWYDDLLQQLTMSDYYDL